MGSAKFADRPILSEGSHNNGSSPQGTPHRGPFAAMMTRYGGRAQSGICEYCQQWCDLNMLYICLERMPGWFQEKSARNCEQMLRTWESIRLATIREDHDRVGSRQRRQPLSPVWQVMIAEAAFLLVPAIPGSTVMARKHVNEAPHLQGTS